MKYVFFGGQSRASAAWREVQAEHPAVSTLIIIEAIPLRFRAWQFTLLSHWSSNYDSRGRLQG